MTTAHADAAQALPERVRPGGRSARRRWRRWLGWAIGLMVVASAVALGLAYRSRHRVAPIRYETATVDRGPMSARVTATGALSALVTVTVGSQVSGKIESLRVDFGSEVQKGQIIATIEPSLFKSAVAQARSNLSAARASVERARATEVQARRKHARARALLAAEVASQQDYELAEAELDVAVASVRSSKASVEQAEAALAQAKLNLDYCTIRSPIDGVVISRNVDVGQTVAATFQAPTLYTIAQDLTKMQVDTAVAEADVGKIRPQMPVTFTVDAHPTRVLSGVVRQVRDNATTLQNVVTYDAVIDVDNREGLLKPGMTATVTFLYAKRESALRAPNAAFRFRPSAATTERMLGERQRAALPSQLKLDERLIWVLRGERPTPIKVQVGISDGENTEILAGELKAGDRVVTEATLAPGGKPPGA